MPIFSASSLIAPPVGENRNYDRHLAYPSARLLERTADAGHTRHVVAPASGGEIFLWLELFGLNVKASAPTIS
jgi:hypothetical protein